MPGFDRPSLSIPFQSILKPNAYIVAQGPKDSATVADFWQMIWQENVRVVVMLTKVYEFIRVMCTQYWPTAVNEPELVAGSRIEVTLIDEDKLADYIVRTMRVRCLDQPQTSQDSVSVRGYGSTPGHQPLVPCHRSPSIGPSTSCTFKVGTSPPVRTRTRFSSFAVESNSTSKSVWRRAHRPVPCWSTAGQPGPVIHCSCSNSIYFSNGCGRSGTYVCLDANLELADEEGVVDIFNYAKGLRQARVSMIENLEQYRFIYETIEEWYVCGKTWFQVGEISQQMRHKSVKNETTKRNEYQEEFDVSATSNRPLSSISIVVYLCRN